MKLDLFHDLHGSDNLDVIFCCIFVVLPTCVSINMLQYSFLTPFLLRSRKNKYFFCVFASTEARK